MKENKITYIVCSTILSISIINSINIYNINKNSLKRDEVNSMIEDLKKEYNPDAIAEDTMNKYLKSIDLETKLDNVMKETERFKETEFYKEYLLLNELKDKTGIDINGYEEVIFDLSFYTELDGDNGYGDLTASGQPLANGFIANNFLDFGTNIYVEGYGLKVVMDRGSELYFGDVSKIDVYVPRNNGENDDDYYNRVRAMGRPKAKGYILK